MKIGMIASNWRPIPGGKTNIFAPGVIIQNLTDGLVGAGHDVTLFAPKDTITKAKLISEGLNSAYDDYPSQWKSDLGTFLQVEQEYEMVILSKAFEMAKQGEFDLVHVHKTNIEPFFANFIDCPMVVTSHGSYLRAKAPIFSEADKIRLEKYKDVCYFTAASHFVKSQVDFRMIEVIHHGINIEKYQFDPAGGEDLLYVGRMIEEKGPDKALEIAEDLNKKIKIIGDIRVGNMNEIFWAKLSKRIEESELSEYVGFVPFDNMPEYYKKAKVLVLPIDSKEAFGLVIAESMACGTPVVAFDSGAASEIVKNGLTGYICPLGDMAAMEEAINKIYDLSEQEYKDMRKACRKHVEENFSLNKMIKGYEAYYQKVIEDYKTR